MADFMYSFNKLQMIEQGYVNDPIDIGGETYAGISRKYHPYWNGWIIIDAHKIASNTEFPKILKFIGKLQEEVVTFYKNEYWYKICGNLIKYQSIANELLETSVHINIPTAIQFMQIGLNKLNRNQTLFNDLVVDGILGDISLKAINTHIISKDVLVLYKIMNVMQGMYYIKRMNASPIQERFARGWFRRVTIVNTL